MSATTLAPDPTPARTAHLRLVDRVGSDVDAIDLFCGFGGSSAGIHRAGATVRVAANHSARAIETHAANFPGTDHRRADLVNPDAADYVDVKDLPRARFAWFSPSCKFHSRANAKKLYEQGRQAILPGLADDFDQEAYANSERSRVSMLCVIRYAAHHHPEIVVVENVCEVARWGPDGDGSTFRWWLHEMDALGYDVQDCWLNSMFFGVPQSRDRVYLVCSRKGNKRPDVNYRPPATCTSDACQGARVDAVQTWKPRTRAWPLPRWGRYDAQYTYTCPDCRARVRPDVRPALDILDLTLPITRIGDRTRPLADATRLRILAGLLRHDLLPIVTAGAGNVFEATPGNRARTLDQPLATQPASAVHALAAPGMLFQTAHGGRARRLDEPHPTVCASDDRWSLVVPLRRNGVARPSGGPVPTVCAGGGHHALVMRNNSSKGPGGEMVTSVTEPLRTLTTTGHQSLLVPYYGSSVASSIGRPVPTVTTHDRCALVTTDTGSQHGSLTSTGTVAFTQTEVDAIIDDCYFRMLEADPEIRGAMAFPSDYVLLGSKSEKVAGLGNAVTPPVAEWLTGRALATLLAVAA